MTKLFLDTEFNGFGGELISMAMVAEDGREWYEVLPYRHMYLDPWVAEHVVPILGQAPIRPSEFKSSLHTFLVSIVEPQVIVDTAVDLEHLCAQMAGSDWASTLKIPFVAAVYTDADPWSETPHNALSDARALRAWFQQEFD